MSERCWWCGDDPEYVAYHDEEWGVPVESDDALFEKISLEVFQSGLSFKTILKKRSGFRSAFLGFDVERVAAFGARDVERLLGDVKVVRHRGKIEATINNACRAVEMIEREGGLGRWLWQFEPAPHERPHVVTRGAVEGLSKTPRSEALSRELKRLGWRFVGPTTVYAFMQAAGLVNDHLETCPSRAKAQRARTAFRAG